MPVPKVKEFLAKHNVRYTVIDHPIAYSAKEVSHVSHISEKQLAKTVIMFASNKLIMVVVPASEAVDLKALKESLHENDISLAAEHDFKQRFSDCEVGAMPPLGTLYNMDVYVEKRLAKNKEIAFNSGTHTEIIKLAFEDFEKLVHPTMISIKH